MPDTPLPAHEPDALPALQPMDDGAAEPRAVPSAETSTETGTEAPTEAGATVSADAMVPVADADARDAPASMPPSAAEAAVEADTDEPVVATDLALPEPCADAAPAVGPRGMAGPSAADMSPAACARRLAELFPALFAAQPLLPLKLRVQADIQQRAPGVFTKKSLSIFLHRHTTSTAYLKALAHAPHRADLDGQPAGDISDEHRQAAVAELAHRRSVHDARREAERAAQREAQREALREQRKAERHAHREAAAQARAAFEARAADDAARRERQALLRAWETSTLTQANFCALKGVTPQALEEQLARARQDRAERPPPRPHGEMERQPPRGPHAAPPRRDHPGARGGPGSVQGPRGPGSSRGPAGPNAPRAGRPPAGTPSAAPGRATAAAPSSPSALGEAKPAVPPAADPPSNGSPT